MKKNIFCIMLLIIVGATFLNVSGVEAKDWRKAYIKALKEGKEVELPEGTSNEDGLAYTPPEETVLEEAITGAMEQKAPPCECMKLAIIDYDYDAYLVLKNIYSAGGEVQLDQLCMCATEAGILKAVIARAAMDAKSRDPQSLDEPIFEMDEIAQSQCLGGEEGLAYTPTGEPLIAIPVNPISNPNYASKSTL